MSQDLDQKTIDSIIDKKLALMEAEYEMFKKYDDPNYKGAAHPVDQQQQAEQEKNNEDEIQDDNPEEADEFQEYQGYEKMDDKSEKDEEEEINYDQIEHIDPFSKPLDVEFIKQSMAKIQLPTPVWAQNNEGWEQKFRQMNQQP